MRDTSPPSAAYRYSQKYMDTLSRFWAGEITRKECDAILDEAHRELDLDTLRRANREKRRLVEIAPPCHDRFDLLNEPEHLGELARLARRQVIWAQAWAEAVMALGDCAQEDATTERKAGA